MLDVKDFPIFGRVTEAAAVLSRTVLRVTRRATVTTTFDSISAAVLEATA